MFILLTCYGQKDSKILMLREQGVKADYADAYVAHFLTGKRYAPNYLRIINGPFFMGKHPDVNGFLVYDGVLFNGLEIGYDIYSQQLVVLLISKKNKKYISVDIEKISRFSIDDKVFTFVHGDMIMKKGIYQLAYDGSNSILYIKRSKEITESSKEGEYNAEFTPVNKYYIKNEFGTFNITNKKSFINVFHNEEKVVALLKQNKIKLSRKNFEEDLIKAISLIDSKSPIN